MSKLDDEIKALERIRINVLDEPIDNTGFWGSIPRDIVLFNTQLMGNNIAYTYIDEADNFPEEFVQRTQREMAQAQQAMAQQMAAAHNYGQFERRVGYQYPGQVYIPYGFDVQREMDRAAFNLIPVPPRKPKTNWIRKFVDKFRGR